MKKLFFFLLLISFNSCKEKPVVNVKEPLQKEELTEAPTKPEATEIYEPVPPVISPGANNAPPGDAIVLFDGTNLDQWISAIDSTAVAWILNKDGSMTVKNGAGDIQTKENFGNVQLHLEWRSSAEIRADGQNRSNSGVYLQNRYEIQILDNNNNDTYVNGQVGSLYKQAVPLAMTSVPTGDWNTYDIIYHAPEFDNAGLRTKAGDITLIHNGVLVLDHVEIQGTTEYIGWPKNSVHGLAPIKLQDHNDNSGVSFRNIWLRKL